MHAGVGLTRARGRLWLRASFGLERLDHRFGGSDEFRARTFAAGGLVADPRAFEQQREGIGEHLRLGDAGRDGINRRGGGGGRS